MCVSGTYTTNRKRAVCKNLAGTLKSAIEVWVGGHLEAWVGHQKAGDVGEAGVDVFPHVLQLLMLVL